MSKRRESSPSASPPAEAQLATEVAEIVAHEINNLLNNILLNAAVLDRKGLDAGRAELTAIRQAGTRAGAIINRWQQLSPRPAVTPEPADLNRLVESATASWQPPAGVQAHFTPAPALPPVLAVPAEVGRLVRLLLDHAAAAAGPGTIEARTQRGEGEALLTVEDVGPAIEAGLLERIFEPFFTARPLQAANELDPQQDLGLALGKKLARRQQGTIHAENRAEGGVRVVVRFRLAPEPKSED